MYLLLMKPKASRRWKICQTHQLLLQGDLVELQLVNLGGRTTREQGSGSDKGCLHIGDKTQKSEKTNQLR